MFYTCQELPGRIRERGSQRQQQEQEQEEEEDEDVERGGVASPSAPSGSVSAARNVLQERVRIPALMQQEERGAGRALLSQASQQGAAGWGRVSAGGGVEGGSALRRGDLENNPPVAPAAASGHALLAPPPSPPRRDAPLRHDDDAGEKGWILRQKMKRAGAKAILKGYPLWQERGLMAESCRRMRTTCRTPAARGFGAVPSSGASLFRERVDLGKLSRIVSFFGAPPSETGGGPPCGSPAAIRGLLGILSDQDPASLLITIYGPI